MYYNRFTLRTSQILMTLCGCADQRYAAKVLQGVVRGIEVRPQLTDVDISAEQANRNHKGYCISINLRLILVVYFIHLV